MEIISILSWRFESDGSPNLALIIGTRLARILVSVRSVVPVLRNYSGYGSLVNIWNIRLNLRHSFREGIKLWNWWIERRRFDGSVCRVVIVLSIQRIHLCFYQCTSTSVCINRSYLTFKLLFPEFYLPSKRVQISDEWVVHIISLCDSFVDL